MTNLIWFLIISIVTFTLSNNSEREKPQIRKLPPSSELLDSMRLESIRVDWEHSSMKLVSNETSFYNRLQ